MGDYYHFTKNSPTSYPIGRLLGKVDLGLAAYGITVFGGLLVLLAFSRDTIKSYAAENPEQKDVVSFIKLSDSKQFAILGFYLGWYIYELLVALMFFFSTKLLLLRVLKFWMLITILNCFLGFIVIVWMYGFIDNKPVFIVGVMVVYMYKLFCIYTIDMFLKEIVGRRCAAAMAALM